MNDGKKVTRFKTVAPVMIYLPIDEEEEFKEFAKKNKLTNSQVAREGIKMRINGSDYNAGFNDGLNEAMKVAENTEGAGMMFPSGKSFGKLVAEAIEKEMRAKNE
jgi:hypothetical protein